MSPQPPDLRPPLEVGIHGVHRHREWDAVQAVRASGFKGDDVQFVVLPDGSSVIEWDEPPGSFTDGEEPFAAAVRKELRPPFRVRVVRAAAGFVAGGRRITVVELPIEGEELTLRVAGQERELRVNGWPAVAGAAELEQLVSGRFADYFVYGNHLSEAFWEIEVTPL